MDDANPEQRPSRGRPRSRYAERSEQVKQNMRLYRRVGRESYEILKKTT